MWKPIFNYLQKLHGRWIVFGEGTGTPHRFKGTPGVMVKLRTAELSRRLEQLQLILNTIPGVVGYWNKDHINQFANFAYRDWSGLSPSQIEGRHFRDVFGAEKYSESLPHIEAALRGESQIFEGVFKGTAQLGDVRYGELHYIPDHQGGEVVGFITMIFDITRRKNDEKALQQLSEQLHAKGVELHHLAFHDALTGLPNRALFQERLEHAISCSNRNRNRLSVTFLDLDGFKAVNDTLGHDIGDLLLKEIANRINARLRRGTDTVARLGGDEFVVLMEGLGEAENCAGLASEIMVTAPRY
jgi:PAS domain S-box-containing protein